MAILRLGKLVGALAFGTALCVAVPASAIEILPPANNGVQLRNNAVDLNVLRSQIQRQQFQQQQQQYRAEDREVVVPRRQEVPRMRQNCQIQVYGSSYTTVCR